MKKPELFTQYFHLHIIVLLLGFTAILGALISLPAIHLVWYRTIFAAIGLMVFFLLFRIPFRLSLKKQYELYAIGLLVALHWITFFHAIKVSNVSVTLGVFASATLFTALIEPLIQKRRIFWLEVLIGLVILFGIYLIFQFEFQYKAGILYSLLSSFLYGLFVVLNRHISMKYHPTVITFYELLGGVFSISVYLAISGGFHSGLFRLAAIDLVYLLILGFLCTSYAFAAIVFVMRKLSAYTVVLAINLEPLYGIIMALLFFPETERMSGGFYLGALIILSSVFSYPILRRKFGKELA